MERVEEAALLLEYVKKHPKMKFTELAKLICAENPDFTEDTDLILRLARISWNYYHS